MKTKSLIRGLAARQAISAKGINQWLDRRADILRALDGLQPDRPDDKTTGFLSYNVADDKPRMKMKTGRFLARKLKLNSGFLPDHIIQNLAGDINRALYPDIGIELLKGAAIRRAYRDAIGSSSCMTEGDCDKVGLYADNPGRFQMLTMQYINDSARAIVHQLDNGDYLMDRVYTSCEMLRTEMRRYARGENWYYRRTDSAGKMSIYRAGDPADDYNVFVVSDLDYTDGEVPYMDTLTGYNLCGCGLAIFHDDSAECADGDLCQTGGYLDGDDDEDTSSCDHCGDIEPDENMFFIEDGSYCRDCYNDLFVFCEDCQRDRDRETSIYIDSCDRYVCDDCLENYTRCDDCETYFSDDDTTRTDAGRDVCDSCLENYTRCEDCDGYFPPVDTTETDAGRDVCDSCLENYTQCEDCDGYFPPVDTVGIIDLQTIVCMDCAGDYETPLFAKHNPAARAAQMIPRVAAAIVATAYGAGCGGVV